MSKATVIEKRDVELPSKKPRRRIMKLFREDNTDGYTTEERDTLNAEWEAKTEAESLEEHTDEYNEAAKKFSDEVASR